MRNAPDWLVELCKKKKYLKSLKSSNPLIELDTDSAVAKAIDYLKNNAPRAVAFEGGNDTTYKVATRLRDFGLSEGVAFGVIAEHWNEAGGAEPPWDAADLKRIVGNAYNYASGAWGGASGLAEFEPVEILERPQKSKRGLYRVTYEEAAASALDQVGTPLIDDILNLAAMLILYGASGSGKTFLMLDMAFHIAAGLPWNGLATTKGAVLYVAAEGGRGIFKRIAALKKHYGINNVPLDIVPCPIDLLSGKADLKALLSLVAEAEAEHGQRVVLVVIDTLSRALAGGEENASTDMGAFVRNIDKIRDATGASVGIVHHSGKDTARGARGHSLLRAATDTEIEISDNIVRITKQRDIDPLPDMRFTLDKVPLGENTKGKAIGSCVVRMLKKNEFIRLELSQQEKMAFDAFCRCLENSETGIVTSGRWKDEMSLTNLSDRHMERLATQVTEAGWVRKIKRNQYVIAEATLATFGDNGPGSLAT